MPKKFQKGDVVQLKSGGPKITVTEIEGDGDLFCQWFAGSKLSWGSFSPDILQLLNGDSSAEK